MTTVTIALVGIHSTHMNLQCNSQSHGHGRSVEGMYSTGIIPVARK